MALQNVTISLDDLERILDPLIRRAVREELARLISQRGEVFALTPGSPLYEDMQEILARQAQGQVKLYSHAEVWGE
jgi:hypothetical protein